MLIEPEPNRAFANNGLWRGTPNLDVTAYLRRIYYFDPVPPTLATLHALSRAHGLAVPYENVDSCLGIPTALDEAALFDKIVRRRRGGVSRELNGLFAALLRALGFTVTLLSAQKVDDLGRPGPEMRHLMLLIQLEQRWLLDVGSMDTPGLLAPLEDGGAPPFAAPYRLTQIGPLWTVWDKNAQGDWRERYLLRLKPRQLSDFANSECPAPAASLTEMLYCCRCFRVTLDGSLALQHGRLTVTTDGHAPELIPLRDANWLKILRDYFGIEFPPR